MKPQPINPEDVDLQKLIDAPLADPLKTFVPLGTRPAKRGPRYSEYDGLDVPRISRKELEARRSEDISEKLGAILDYYAGTSIPVERIATHTGLTIEKATAAMKRRGREIC